METQEEYESRERSEHLRFVWQLRDAPLAERKEARADWLEAMRNERDIIAERLLWLFQGAYGKGAQLEAERISGNARMNQEAALGQLLAAVEWQCADSEARKAWGELSAEDAEAVTKTFATGLARYLEEQRLASLKIPFKILRAFHGTAPYIAGTTDDPEWASRLPYGAAERYIVLVCPDCGADKAFPESEFAK